MNSVPRSLYTTITRRTLAALAAFLLLFISMGATAAAQNTISTVAGGGSVNGSATGTNADIPGPSGVTKDSQGNTYVAVPAASEVFKIDTSGNLTVFAGIGYATEDPQKLDNGPATSASLNSPNGVFADNAGNLYIADTTNYLIRKVDSKGIMHTVAGNAHQCQSPTSSCGDGGFATGATMSSPIGVATDAAGNIYIADSKDNKIRVVNTQKGTIVIAGVTIAHLNIATIAGTGVKCATPTMPCGDGGSATAALLNNPQGVVVDSAGNIYVADAGDHRIRIISTAGVITAYAGTGNTCNLGVGCGDGGPALSANISGPWQISLDSAGDLFLTDGPENKVREVVPGSSGNPATIQSVAGSGKQAFGGDGGAPLSAYLNAPHGVWVDATGNITIGDTGNQRVRVVSQSIINTQAGGGSGGDGGSALGSDAILGGDRGIALDPTGNLFIADTGNNRIREVSGGNITTVAGTGIAGYSGNNGVATNAMMNNPDGVATDSAGNVYIADTVNLVVRKLTVSTGVITTVAGTSGHACSPLTACGDGGPATSATFALPTAVSVDAAGDLYIADQGANRIRMVNTSGTITTVAGTGAACANSMMGNCGDGGPATAAQLNGPFSAVVDGLGNIYIADTNDNRIREVQASTGNIVPYAFTGVQFFGPMNVPALQSTYGTPQSLTLDPRGNLYVSGSALYYVVVRIDAAAPGNPVAAVSGRPGDPKYYGFLGDGGLAVGSEMSNQGVTIDGSGHLYIADGGNNRVREVVVTPAATLSSSGLVFPSEPIGTTSPAMNFNLNNMGSDDLLISSITVTGDFALSPANPCTNNQVAPEQPCTFSVTFTPTTYGTRSGKVIINDNAYQDPTQTVFLTGFGPDFAITAVPTTLSVAPGAQGMSTLTLTPSAGFNQTVNLTCTGGPPNSPCTITPSSVTLDGTDAATANLTISVNANTGAGSYTLKATGTSVTKHSATIALTVQ